MKYFVSKEYSKVWILNVVLMKALDIKSRFLKILKPKTQPAVRKPPGSFSRKLKCYQNKNTDEKNL